MTWNPAFRMVRPDDLIVLDVSVSGPQPQRVTPPTPGGATHVFAKVTGGREIRVQFGPQQVIEYATPTTGTRANQNDPLFVPRTDLIFSVPGTQLVQEAYRRHLTVIPWTVDDPATAQHMIDSGVDGLITNYPSRTRQLLADNGFKLPRAYRPPS